MKRIWPLFAVLALLCALTIPALAAAGGTADAEPAAQTVSEEELAHSEENTTKVRKIWAVAALVGVACFGGALGMAHIRLRRRRTTWPSSPRRRGRSARR